MPAARMSSSVYVAIFMAASMLLPGCAVYDGYAWVKQADITETRIRMVKDTTVCKWNEMACSRRTGNECVIHVPADKPELVGHEAVHCFGWVHH